VSSAALRLRPGNILFLPIMLGATLLFLAQPLFAKMVLPRFGGSPAVWNTCVVCYQVTLLAGYAYAHLLATRCSLRRQIVLHLALIWFSAFFLPFHITPSLSAANASIFAVVRIFLTALAPAFFMLAATTPLLQSWQRHLPGVATRTLFRVYAFSNFGSLLALLSYPFVIEPFLRLSAQTSAWRNGYLIFAALLSAGGLVGFWQGSPAAPRSVAPPTSAPDAISGRQCVAWVWLSALPSGLLLAVTQYITTDIAPLPLFWVIPLAGYLLTFMLVFADLAPIRAASLRNAQTYLIVPLLMVFFAGIRTVVWLDLGFHLTIFCSPR